MAMRKVFAASFAALLFTGALAGCGEDAPPAATAQAAPATGPVFTLRAANVERWVPVSAEVSTVDQAQVIARIPGILTSLNVREGDSVGRGQVIGRIVDSQLGYQAGAYGAQAAAAQAQAAQAQSELARTRYLTENGVYAPARLEQAEAMAAAAQAQVRAARAQQQAVGAVAGQGAVVAPASGRVLAADIPPGSPVAPGMVIATITSGPVVLRLDLPESFAGNVRPGAAVRMTLDDGQMLSGTIARVYPSVMGGQVRADANVLALGSTLIGRRVSAEVAAGGREALMVPARYVTTRYGIDYVTVLGEAGPAQVVVQTAPSGEDGQLEVLSGLAAGDRLVPPAGRD